MAESVTARSLYEAQGERLALQWVAGQPGDGRAVRSRADGGRFPFAAPLDLVHPHPVQVLGEAELDYLNGLGASSRRDAIRRLFDKGTAMVVVCGADPVSDDIRRAATVAATPVFRSPLPIEKVAAHLDDYLDSVLAVHVTLHGVMMEVAGLGVLLTGESGVGKSELALELISRGHRLIADDAPELQRVAPDTLSAACPPALCDFMEVRGLGVLNIRAMFGDRAIKHDMHLRLIIHLEIMEEGRLRRVDRLHGSRQGREIQGVTVPQVTLPVVPGRNLSVLVECAVRNHILHMEGYNADLDFIERQRHHLARDKS